MIELNVEDLCHRCPDFAPEADFLWANDQVAVTTVQCADRDRCRRLREFLRREAEKTDKEKRPK